jgi:transposase
MWTIENRARYNRDQLRYPSDTTDEEWTERAPVIPPARRGGRKRTVNIREVLNGLLYVLSTGCQWRALPKDFPPRSTVFYYFGRGEADGTLRRLHDAVYVRCREQAGRALEPTACIIDSQRVKSTEKGGRRLIRWVLTRANKSKGESVTCEWIPWGCSCTRSCLRPIYKIGTAGLRGSRHWLRAFRCWLNCSPMALIRGRSFARAWRSSDQSWL